uniref:CDP-diacylglycerol--inositol 3-phosphatidyltransferase n=1 Tax=Tetradesmus obliquus TaxID=3088 RepID=A0A383VZW6_TETOB|eukprot:jgi/Sobl393_1/18939/SZX69936.1
MADPGFFSRHKNIYMYLPNLIGYARILLTLGALAFAFSYPELCVGAYFLAFVCDELDGRAARSFNQTSTLGAVLDMVTDRVATTGLLALLCATYPSLHLLFISLIALDIFSHWFQMYASLLAGAASHKDVASRSWLVRTYYRNRLFMGFCCVCCEVQYLALFLLHLPAYQTLGLLPLRLPQPLLDAAAGSVLEGYVNSWQGLPAVGVVALLALPGVLVKQACNWVQLRTAMQGLVDYDVKKMT